MIFSTLVLSVFEWASEIQGWCKHRDGGIHGRRRYWRGGIWPGLCCLEVYAKVDSPYNQKAMNSLWLVTNTLQTISRCQSLIPSSSQQATTFHILILISWSWQTFGTVKGRSSFRWETLPEMQSPVRVCQVTNMKSWSHEAHFSKMIWQELIESDQMLSMMRNKSYHGLLVCSCFCHAQNARYEGFTSLDQYLNLKQTSDCQEFEDDVCIDEVVRETAETRPKHARTWNNILTWSNIWSLTHKPIQTPELLSLWLARGCVCTLTRSRISAVHIFCHQPPGCDGDACWSGSSKTSTGVLPTVAYPTHELHPS